MKSAAAQRRSSEQTRKLRDKLNNSTLFAHYKAMSAADEQQAESSGDKKKNILAWAERVKGLIDTYGSSGLGEDVVPPLTRSARYSDLVSACAEDSGKDTAASKAAAEPATATDAGRNPETADRLSAPVDRVPVSSAARSQGRSEQSSAEVQKSAAPARSKPTRQREQSVRQQRATTRRPSDDPPITPVRKSSSTRCQQNHRTASQLSCESGNNAAETPTQHPAENRSTSRTKPDRNTSSPRARDRTFIRDETDEMEEPAELRSYGGRQRQSAGNRASYEEERDWEEEEEEEGDNELENDALENHGWSGRRSNSRTLDQYGDAEPQQQQQQQRRQRSQSTHRLEQQRQYELEMENSDERDKIRPRSRSHYDEQRYRQQQQQQYEIEMENSAMQNNGCSNIKPQSRTRSHSRDDEQRYQQQQYGIESEYMQDDSWNGIRSKSPTRVLYGEYEQSYEQHHHHQQQQQQQQQQRRRSAVPTPAMSDAAEHAINGEDYRVVRKPRSADRDFNHVDDDHHHHQLGWRSSEADSDDSAYRPTRSVRTKYDSRDDVGRSALLTRTDDRRTLSRSESLSAKRHGLSPKQSADDNLRPSKRSRSSDAEAKAAAARLQQPDASAKPRPNKKTLSRQVAKTNVNVNAAESVIPAVFEQEVQQQYLATKPKIAISGRNLSKTSASTDLPTSKLADDYSADGSLKRTSKDARARSRARKSALPTPRRLWLIVKPWIELVQWLVALCLAHSCVLLARVARCPTVVHARRWLLEALQHAADDWTLFMLLVAGLGCVVLAIALC